MKVADFAFVSLADSEASERTGRSFFGTSVQRVCIDRDIITLAQFYLLDLIVSLGLTSPLLVPFFVSQSTGQRRPSFSSTASFSHQLRRQSDYQSNSNLPLFALGSTSGPRFHPAPPRAEVALLQAVMVSLHFRVFIFLSDFDAF